MIRKILLTILIVLFTICPAFAGTLLTYPKFQAQTATGTPLVGGKLYTYIGGTVSTNKATYSDRACTTANAHPVVLDSRGEATVYLKGLYKLVLKSSAGVTIWSMDNIQGDPQGNYIFYPESTVADHGVVSTGASLKDILTAIGTTTKATVKLTHSGVATNTDYVVATTYDASAYTNVNFDIENGARLSPSTGKTLTLPSPSNIASPSQQIFSGAGTVSFSKGGDIYAGWFGAVDGSDNYASVTKAIASIPSGVGVTLHLPVSLYSETVLINKANVKVEMAGASQTFDASYTMSGAPDYGIYNVMFAVTADDVDFINGKFYQGAFTDPSVFVWYGTTADNGIVDKCRFYNIPYDGALLGVAIQTRTGGTNNKVLNSYFENCAGAVSMQSDNSVIDNCTAVINGSAVTSVADIFDQPFGLDGCDGSSITNTKVHKVVAAPYSGALIGANAGATNFNISHNYINGIKGAVGIMIASSNDGIVDSNIIDGGGLVAIGVWAMISVDATSNRNTISNNKLLNPSTLSGSPSGIQLPTAGNIVKNNDIRLASGAYACIRVITTTVDGTLLIKGNYMKSTERGVYFAIAGQNSMIPIWLSGNTYDGMTSCVVSSGALEPNVPIYFEAEQFQNIPGTGIINYLYNTSANPAAPYFYDELAGKYPHRIAQAIVVYGAAAPLILSWSYGDTVYNPACGAGGSPGWMCTTSGTFSAAATTGSITIGTKTLVVAATAGFYAGDYITIAGVTGVKKIVSIVGTTVTIDSNADATVVGAAVVTPDPVFKAMAVLS